MRIVSVDSNNKQIFKTTYIDAFREGFVGFTPNKFIDDFSNNFDKYYNDCCGNLEMYICYENENPAGVIVFGKSQIENSLESDAEIDSIYFKKEFHGLGIALKTMIFALNKLKENGFNRVLLWCSMENERAWHFYKKLGFEPTDKKWNDELDGKVFHNILFIKNI